MEANEEKVYYGIWVLGKGWLKAKDVVAFANRSIAQQVAKRIGKDATVLYIDPSIKDLEHLYLENESRSLWKRLKSILFQPTKNSLEKK